MAAPGSVEAILSSIPDPQLQRAMKNLFRYILTNLAFGRATGSTSQSAASTAVPSENLVGGYFTATTPGVANQEFAVAHSFGHAPYLAVPVLPLDQVNASMVQLTVSRAADASNVYFKSPATSQPIYLYIEG